MSCCGGSKAMVLWAGTEQNRDIKKTSLPDKRYSPDFCPKTFVVKSRPAKFGAKLITTKFGVRPSTTKREQLCV